MEDMIINRQSRANTDKHMDKTVVQGTQALSQAQVSSLEKSSIMENESNIWNLA